MADQRVSILMTEHDELVEAKRERDRLKGELTELRGLVGRAILSLQKDWSTAALDVLERSVTEKTK